MVNYKKRVTKLQALKKSAKVNAWLLSSKNDIFYYTGYRPSDSGFLLLKGRPRLFVSPLENEAEKVKGIDVVFADWKGLVKELKRCGKVGYDESSLLVGSKLKLKGVKLKPVADYIKKLRQIKELEELREIKKAISITRKVMGELRLLGRPETEIVKQIKMELLGRGFEPAFEPIVAAGPNGYYIHHKPGKRIVKKSDLVVVDMGTKVNGYCSDLTMTYCEKVGRKERKVIEDVRNIHETLIDNVCAGIKWKDFQKLYEKELKRRGYKVWHGAGHGVGLNVHELVGDKLEQGMVITVEPAVYMKGFGGCRFEDMVLVEKNKGKLL